MTSNIGSELISQKLREGHLKYTRESIFKLVEPALTKHFRPEFLNRIDDILPFIPLQEKDMISIVKIQIKELQKRLKDREIKIEIKDDLLEHLAKEGYDPVFGARPLKRYIQTEITNLLSKKLIEGTIHSKEDIVLSLNNSKEITVAKKN
jgi:ATP-dependent Clp protease ATP-binding subunit ClpB